MLALPIELTRLYETLVTQQGVATEQRPHYAKWLRYYWDFCHKYGLEPRERQSFAPFDEKLRVKNQSDSQGQQAHPAVALYYEGVLTERSAGQELPIGVPANGSGNRPLDSGASTSRPAESATAAPQVRLSIAGPGTPRQDEKPARMPHLSTPPNRPPPPAAQPIGPGDRIAEVSAQPVSRDKPGNPDGLQVTGAS
jgi:hypothetical protein